MLDRFLPWHTELLQRRRAEQGDLMLQVERLTSMQHQMSQQVQVQQLQQQRQQQQPQPAARRRRRRSSSGNRSPARDRRRSSPARDRRRM